MGIAKKGLTLVALTFGMALSANAATYQAADDTLESKLCVTAATGSKLKMNKAIQQFRSGTNVTANYRIVANKLYCNGVDVAEFAATAGNYAVAEKLEGYRSSNVQIRDIANISHGSVHVGGSK